jgi:hypothetical protein
VSVTNPDLTNPFEQARIAAAWQADEDEDRATLDADLETIAELERRERELDYESECG